MSSMPDRIATASIYQPLNESPDDHALQQIRLITIDHLPRDDVTDHSLITCSMRTAALGASKNSYYALSYVWGNAHDTETILVNGQKFQATKNLVHALRHVGTLGQGLRYKPPFHSSFRTHIALWVDAICINQNNIPERNNQVSAMGTIYRNASHVLCWLGHSDKITAAGMEFVNRLTEALQSVPDPFNSGHSPFEDPNLGRLIGEMEGHSLLTLPIFLQAPYWERAWTTQEMALARSCVLIAGRGYCLLDHVGAITGWARKFVNRTDTGWKNSAGLTPSIRTFLRDIESFSEHSLPLVHAKALCRLQDEAQLQALHGSAHDLTMANLGHTILRNATDPRDKIYSLAMMGPIGIKINYASHVQEVYTDFATQIVTKLTDINHLIEKAGLINRESKLHLPTWVPDWSIDNKALSKYGIVQRCPASVNKHLSSSGAASVTGSQLHLLGMKIDHIQDVMPQAWEIETKDELERIVKVTNFLYNSDSRTILEQILSEPPKSRTYPTGIPKLTAILSLLQAQGQVQDGQWEPDVLSMLVPFIRCVASSAELKGQLAYSWDNSSFFITDDRPGHQLPEKSKRGVAKDLLSRICDPSRNEPLDLDEVLADAHWLSDDDLFRDFMWLSPFTDSLSPFITSEGYIGYTKVGIQPGDIICAVGACSMPIVLRPVGNRHEFLSTCCVIGIMDGGLFEKQSKTSLHEFVIV